MWGVLVCMIAILAGCSADLCQPPRQVVAPSSNTERGSLQFGQFQFEAVGFPRVTPSLAARADGGVACVTCNGIFSIDASFHSIGRLDSRDSGGVVAAPDHAIYAKVPGSQLGTTDIVALTASGTVRWRSTIGTPAEAVDLIGSDDSLYVNAAPRDDTSQLTQTTLFALDAATGAQRIVATGLSVIGPSHRGVIVVPPHEAMVQPTVQQIDPDGHLVWSHQIQSSTPPAFLGTLATADGGVLVFGLVYANVDLGDRTIPIANLHPENGFVAAFDATGATQWGFAVDSGGVTHVAVTPDGQLLVASERQVGGGLFSPEIDTYLAVATTAGVIRSLTIDGFGAQQIRGLAAAPDGTAWIQVDNARTSDSPNEPPSILQIGGKHFPEEGSYLFKIVP